MGKAVEVKFKGLNQLYSQFKMSSKEAESLTEQAMQSTLARAQRIAKPLSRIRTGNMRNNINVKPIENNGSTIKGTIVSEAEYSSFNEYGTYKMSAKPFMRPAAKAATPWFYKSVQDALRRAGHTK